MFFNGTEITPSNCTEIAKKMYEENQNAIDNLFKIINIVMKVAKLLESNLSEYECFENSNFKKKYIDMVKEIMSECYGNKELNDYTPKFDALDEVLIYAKSKSNTTK